MRAPEFWKQDSVGSRLLAASLSPLGWLYGTTVAHKAAHTKPYRSSAKVICAGNLVAGGTGKTPIAMTIVGCLAQRGLRVVVLTRGYGGRVRGPMVVNPQSDSASAVGDEALVLASASTVIVSSDRSAGAKLAEAEGADVIVMDDGHQNFTLGKDLSLVVVDSDQGFGNGRVLPAGPLREPIKQGLARADAVILVGENTSFLPKFTGPILRARLVADDSPELVGHRVIAFAGIGRPEKFFGTLRTIGANIISTHAFADHHRYSQAELANLRAQSHAKDAQLITTEKDYVRLTLDDRVNVRCLPIRAVFDDPVTLSNLLGPILLGAIERGVQL